MKHILLFLSLFFSFHTFSQDKVKFFAAGITCSMCSNAIHKSLTSDKNILKVEPNLNTQEWFLEYQKGTFDLENLKKRVSDAGFTVSQVWLNSEMIYEIKKKKK